MTSLRLWWLFGLRGLRGLWGSDSDRSRGSGSRWWSRRRYLGGGGGCRDRGTWGYAGRFLD